MEQYFTNNENLKSERRIIDYTYKDKIFQFISDNGVFSKDHIDTGSIALVNAYLKNKKEINNFLDVGCGYGFISILLSKELNAKGLGVDVNKRALKLAEENAKENKADVKFLESNCYQNVEGTFDLVITNPPIRAGKQIVLEILKGAKEHLKEEGELWFVIRKDQGAKSIVKSLENVYQITNIDKFKGFYIFMAKKN